jgi:CIC family chloride channel protein
MSGAGDSVTLVSDRRLSAITTLGALVGLVGGVGAWAFRLMIGFIHNLAFNGQLSFTYDANQHTPSSPWGVLIVLVPVVGSVIVVYLVKHYAPEARGHGVPEVMDALYYRSGVIRPVVALVKAVASAVSIGTGGSVGREGPIVQIGSAFGSSVGQYRRLSVADKQLLIAAGSAAGIAATFNAPIGGVLFALELLMVSVSARALLVVGVAVGCGVSVARALLGSGLSFAVLDLQHVTPLTTDWVQLVVVAGLGLAIGAVSAGLIQGLYVTEDLFDGRFRSPYLAHAVGMAGVGVVIVVFHYWLGIYAVEGVGYATILDVLTGTLTNPWVLLALLAAKALVTFLTLGSGASGGVFSPALFVGATGGALVGHVLVHFGMSVDPVVLALSGMAATVAGTTGAVLTGVVMVTEMTGDFGAAVPLLLAAAIALAIRRRLSATSIYTEKLSRRGLWVPSGLRPAGVDAIRARDLMVSDHPDLDSAAEPLGAVDANASLFDVIAAFDGASAVRVTESGSSVGLIERADLDRELRSLGVHGSRKV